MDMVIEIASGIMATEVPEDAAADFAEAYAVLAKLPVNRQVSVTFTGTIREPKETQEEADARAARLWVKQGKAWAASQIVTREDGSKTPLTFARKGDVKALPARVSFRIYAPRPGKNAE